MWPILIIFVCILMNAVLAGIEIAFINVNRALVRNRAESGDERAAQLLRLKKHPERTLSTIQIGITLLGAVSAAVGGTAAGLNLVPMLQEELGISLVYAEFLAVLLVVLPITYLSVVVGEITPKALALRAPYYYSTLGTPILKILASLLYPIVKICEISTIQLLKFLPFHKNWKTKRKERDQEYERALRGYRKLSPKGKEYLINLGNLEEKSVADVFLQWKDVDYVTTDLDLETLESKIISSGHTRMPVLENESVVGFINTKEVLALTKSKKNQNWKDLIRQPYTFPLTAHPLKVLRILQTEHMHMGIVEDENKALSGIITIEDIIEDILGEIYDEDDEGSISRILG